MPKDKKKIKFDYEYLDNKDLAVYKKLKELDDKFDLKKGDKGDKGDKPIAGVDYKIPKDGKDGIDGKDGYTPIKNKDYFDGIDGKDGKDGSPDTPKQIADKLNTLKEKVEIKVIKDLEKRLNEKKKETIKEIPKSKAVERYIQKVSGGGGASFHTALNDMPDTGGTNTDHDVRYVAKVQDDEPTTPTPFEGMFWYDTDAISSTIPYVVDVKTKDDDYTIDNTADYVILVDTTLKAITITLPTAVDNSGRVFVIKNIGQAGNSVLISPNGSEEIDGVASQTLLDLTSERIASDSSNWWII